jgi:hypothetical protein
VVYVKHNSYHNIINACRLFNNIIIQCLMGIIKHLNYVTYIYLANRLQFFSNCKNPLNIIFTELLIKVNNGRIILRNELMQFSMQNILLMYFDLLRQGLPT